MNMEFTFNTVKQLQLGGYAFNYVENAQGCYISTLKPLPNGYVQVYVKNHRRKLHLHRLAYAEYNAFGRKLRLTHTCGNRNCFNPAHITEIRESDARGGTNNPNAKLTDEIARSIYVSKGTYAEIAEKFNTNVTLVGRVKRNEAWIHATAGLAKPNVKMGRPTKK